MQDYNPIFFPQSLFFPPQINMILMKYISRCLINHIFENNPCGHSSVTRNTESFLKEFIYVHSLPKSTICAEKMGTFDQCILD